MQYNFNPWLYAKKHDSRVKGTIFMKIQAQNLLIGCYNIDFKAF